MVESKPDKEWKVKSARGGNRGGRGTGCQLISAGTGMPHLVQLRKDSMKKEEEEEGVIEPLDEKKN